MSVECEEGVSALQPTGNEPGTKRPPRERSRVLTDALVRRTEGVQPWRRAFHAAGGAAMAGFVWIVGAGSATARWTFAGLLAAAAILDLVRLLRPAANAAFFRFFSQLASPREASAVASSTWYAASALCLSLWAATPVFAAAMLVLAFADPAASVAGRLLGRRRLGAGTWVGTAVFAGVAFVVLAFSAGPLVALAVAPVAAAAEVLPTGIDDNLVVPLVTALALSAAGVGG